ncbi:hypothetical protein SAMN05660964_02147 [Thiothrix caldifontis]|uniref:Uncharacterized protein n=1 Tax=Thiothrix caldifontis TaxID=525918 RepID=A0A1H4D4F1_9GAMM|nr:hypothetical protein [Thiothrix caldifontis]SEA67468.1 hypothetical protein SAMN05660964_02147 [Thiothrix caldifontis]
MIEDALTSYDIRKFYLSILYVIRRIDDVPGIYFLNNHQEHHPMQKHILSTCLAISLIANSSYVFADKTITGTGSSSSESEMSDGQAAAVVGGLLLLGGILSLHSQSVAKAEETATQQATKTVELKPGHTYLWSTGNNDTSLTIQYVESCTPAKQYSVTSKLVNGAAEVEDSNVSIKSEGCSKTYDSREKSMNEQAGDPWGLKTRYTRVQAEEKAQEARREAESKVRDAKEAQAKQQKMAAAYAKGCSGLYVNKVVKTGSAGGFAKMIGLTHEYVIIGIDKASQSVTLKNTYDGSMLNTECANIQYNAF